MHFDLITSFVGKHRKWTINLMYSCCIMNL